MTEQIGLHQRLLLSHRSDVDNLLADEQVVFLLGQQQVGQILDALDRCDIRGAGTTLAVVHDLSLELAQLAGNLIGGEVDGGIHICAVLGNANHRAAGTNRDLDDCRVGVRGVLLITKHDVDCHGLDIENLERLADLLIHMRTQSIGYRRLASRNLDIHTWLQSASGTYCTGYVPIAVHLITRIPKDPNNDCLIPHTEVSHFSVAKCAMGGRRRLCIWSRKLALTCWFYRDKKAGLPYWGNPAVRVETVKRCPFQRIGDTTPSNN